MDAVSVVYDNYMKGTYYGITNANHIHCSVQKADLFLEALEGNKESSALEIGVYQGDSALLWLELMKRSGQVNPLLTVDMHMPRI